MVALKISARCGVTPENTQLSGQLLTQLLLLIPGEEKGEERAVEVEILPGAQAPREAGQKRAQV